MLVNFVRNVTSIGNQGFPNVSSSDLVMLIDADNDGDFDMTSTTIISNPVDLGGNSFVFNGVTDLADNLRFTVATTNASNTPLPVELADFKLTMDPLNQVVITWETLSETNNDYFTVERSPDGTDWHELARVSGAGNSTSFLTYLLTDTRPIAGRSYYRLKQTDFDGRYEFHGIQTITIPDPISRGIVYPNPAQDFIILSSTVSSIRVLDIAGRDVSHLVPIKVEAGLQKLNISELEEGTYLLKNSTSTYRFIKE